MGIYRVVMNSILFGQTCQNVAHFQKAGSWTTALADALNVEIRDFFLNNIKNQTSSSTLWNSILCYDAESALTPNRTLLVNIVGSQGSFATQVAPFSCVIFRLRTAQAGPAGRGRLYLPGCAPSQFVSGVMNAGSIASWQTILNTLGPRYTGASPTSGYHLVVLARANPSGYKDVITLEVGSIMGVQRRRNIGVGV